MIETRADMGGKISLPTILRGAGLAASLGSLFAFAYLLLTATRAGLGDASVPVLLVTAVTLFVLGEVLRWRAGRMLGTNPLDDKDPLTVSGARPAGIARPKSEALHEAVYNDAFRKQEKHGAGALSEAERLTLHLVPLHIYVTSNGLQGGISGFGSTETRASLPYLFEVGLPEVAELLEGYLDKDPALTDDPERTRRDIMAAGFDDIPARVDAYLDAAYPWA